MLKSGKISFPGMVTDIIALDDCVEKGVDRQDKTGQLKILIDPSLWGLEYFGTHHTPLT